MLRKWIIDYASIFIVALFSPLLLIAKIANNPSFTLKCIRWICRPINWFAGNRYHIENLNYLYDSNNYILISNHLSGFDVVTLSLIADKPIRFIAQKQLEIVPIAKDWFDLMGTIFIDQNNPADGLVSISECIKALKHGENVGIFPTGTIAIDPIPFKEGAIKIAEKTKVRIVPLTIHNTRSIFEERHDNSIVDTHFYFHPPLDYDDYKDMNTDELTKYLEDMIYTKYNEYRNLYDRKEES